MQIVYKAADIMEAHIVSGMLQANGIDAHVGGHYLQGAIGELAPMGFANVSVADQDVAAALPIIHDYEHGSDSADSGLSRMDF